MHSTMPAESSSRNIRVLLICNAYPSSSNLYRNGFIHRRVKGYVENGIDVEIFYNHEPVANPYEYQFDGINVLVGNENALSELIESTEFDAFLVHFAEPTRINPLRKAGVKQPVIVWVHGFEAEAWYRRWFNFIDSSEHIREALHKKKHYYDGQNSFFADLVNDEQLDLHFVNVSSWFQKNVVEPDVKAEFRDSEVIHNLVDEDVFPFTEKSDAKRKKILSLRPFASMKYANDLTVAAILELSKRPYFNDLEFTICGEGQLFDKTVAPLRKFKNVQLKNQFFTQSEISKLHDDHGIFLCPTRFDSQGVSMCEAMSSGLVAISSDVSAIPEFITHEETGLLAKAESSTDLADLVEELYFDEELFQSISRTGSSTIKDQCGKDATIGKEISLIASLVG